MEAQSLQRADHLAGLPVRVVPIQRPFEYRKNIHDLIERCAYELYESRGFQDGHALEDWRDAKLKLYFSEPKCAVGLIELDEMLDVEASVGNFNAKDLVLCVEPLCLTISGDHHAYPAEHPQLIFRVLELPVEVDPRKATARLEGEMLHVLLPKRAKTGKPRAAADAA